MSPTFIFSLIFGVFLWRGRFLVRLAVQVRVWWNRAERAKDGSSALDDEELSPRMADLDIRFAASAFLVDDVEGNDCTCVFARDTGSVLGLFEADLASLCPLSGLCLSFMVFLSLQKFLNWIPFLILFHCDLCFWIVQSDDHSTRFWMDSVSLWSSYFITLSSWHLFLWIKAAPICSWNAWTLVSPTIITAPAFSVYITRWLWASGIHGNFLFQDGFLDDAAELTVFLVLPACLLGLDSPEEEGFGASFFGGFKLAMSWSGMR